MRQSLLLISTLTLAAATPALAQAPAFKNPPTLPPSPGWSQLAEVPAGSKLVFISGQVAMDQSGRIVALSNFRGQAEQVFQNLDRALRASGATFKDVVKLTYYVLDVTQLPTLREVRDNYVNRAAPPASTLVQVSALFTPGILLEIEAVAVVPAAAPAAP